MSFKPIDRKISHYTIKQLYYFADDELVEVLGRLNEEERQAITSHPWVTDRILRALSKLEAFIPPQEVSPSHEDT